MTLRDRSSRFRFQIIAVGHDREDPGGVCSIPLEMDIEHQVDRTLRVIPHHPPSHRVETSREPVVIEPVVLLETDRLVPGSIERVGDRVRDRRGSGRLLWIPSAGISVPLHDNHAQGPVWAS